MKSFETNTGPSTALRPGIPGFEYSDLHKSERLKELLDVFDCEVAAANPVTETHRLLSIESKHRPYALRLFQFNFAAVELRGAAARI